MKHWQHRHNARLFQDLPVDPADTDAIARIIQYIPTQRSINDNAWFLVQPEHQRLRSWLMNNVHSYSDETVPGGREYMPAVLSAPVIFLGTMVFPTAQKVSNLLDASRNIGITSGVIASEALRMGYDVSFVGCCEHYFSRKEQYEELTIEFRDILYETFTDSFVAELETDPLKTTFQPNISMCIGYATEESKKVMYDDDLYSVYQGYHFRQSRKRRKSFRGLVK